MNILGKLFGGAADKPEPEFSGGAVAPANPVYVVGDIHGRADLLDRLLARISEHSAAPEWEDFSLVFVGDYVDRGDASAEVLGYLMALGREAGGRLACLMGNHEKMMLDFLDRPEERGQRWLRNGGMQTLSSYRITGVNEMSEPAALTAAAAQLREALADTGAEEWLRALPLRWQSGNLAVVHAAADPTAPIEAQEDRTLLWGNKDFTRVPRTDGVWVAHGHTIVPEPLAHLGRISVDTGAYYSERLTAAAIARSGEIAFLTS